MRSSAAVALGIIGTEVAIPGLLELLKDSESNVRSSAVNALVRIGTEAAIPGLLELLKDSESNVRSSAAAFTVCLCLPANLIAFLCSFQGSG
ncbi:HEAT repeat domain-containing protein [Anabaena sp. YBS01]|uniref:HEAT repeat domain-containing protein n=1 Tax=Anabaena sp. YBS01 TaxID=2490939 RepID=UPI002102BC2B|nr:HEAT repeat domain-containing protein [Anabaena sp. YBS01]